MAREPKISDEDYQRILQFIRNQGYQIDHLRKVPHGKIDED
jgi:lipocalin